MFAKFRLLLPHFSAFLLCFLAIAQTWLAFNAFFSLVIRYDDTLGALNILMLLPMCLLPFASSIIGDYPDNPFSFVFFGSLYLFSSAMYAVITRYLWKKNMFTSHLDRGRFEKKILKTNWYSLIMVLVIIASAFVSTLLSLLLFFTLLLLWIIMMGQLKLVQPEK